MISSTSTIWIFLLTLLSALHGANIFAKETCKGIWAASARSPYFEASHFTLSDMESPNTQFSIRASDDGLSFIAKTGKRVLLPEKINPHVSEVLWAPDSRHFAINFSDGGAVGTWGFSLYAIRNNIEPSSVDIGNILKRAANKIPDCFSPEDANLGVAAWLSNGTELLVIAQVPPHSSCRNMGDILGLRVSFPSGKIVERIAEPILRTKWRSVLGCRFAK